MATFETAAVCFTAPVKHCNSFEVSSSMKYFSRVTVQHKMFALLSVSASCSVRAYKSHSSNDSSASYFSDDVWSQKLTYTKVRQ
jgi:hypothetical protein